MTRKECIAALVQSSGDQMEKAKKLTLASPDAHAIVCAIDSMRLFLFASIYDSVDALQSKPDKD